MSNNPFRNRINSQPPSEPSPRPISTNPFLDNTELNIMSNGTSYPTAIDNTASVFVSSGCHKGNAACSRYKQSTMAISDDMPELQPTRSRQANPGPRRPEPRENNSFRNFARPSGPGHKISMSEEEQRRLQPRPRAELDIFADPSDANNRDRERRPRRNSESSVRDKTRPLDEEERRRRDRERRARDSRRAGSKSTKPNKKLDVIDKLDVTSIYGMGRKLGTNLVLCDHFLTRCSVPPRWPIRCLQSSQKPQERKVCSDASISQGFSQHGDGWFRTCEQNNGLRQIPRIWTRGTNRLQ